MAAVSVIHELAYALMYIGSSQQRPDEWVQHDKQNKTYPECGQGAVIQEVGKFFSLTHAEQEREYSVYQQLCWAKHGNPILQRVYGAQVTADVVRVYRHPFFSDSTVRFSRFSMLHATRAVSSRRLMFAQHFLSHHRDSVLAGDFDAISDDLSRLGVRDGLSGPDE